MSKLCDCIVCTKDEFTVHDVIAVGYTLDPLVCLYCGSHEVVFMQYIGDAKCQECGKWQLEEGE